MHPQDTGIQAQIRRLAVDRRSPEARAIYVRLASYTEGRVARIGSRRYADLLSGAEREDVVGEVLLQLMSGSLARFRGDSLPELLGYVRSIADRLVWRAAQRKIRERQALQGEGAEAVAAWTSALPQPDQLVELDHESALNDKDAEYLEALFSAGGRAAYARTSGVSRAAVTQRVQRIRARIAAMSPNDQMATEAWAQRLAVVSALRREA
jgi:hypothetical protein